MRRVVFAVVPPIQILDLTGPYEVFARAGGYRVELVTTASGRPLGSSCGLIVGPAKHYLDLRGRIDTLLIPGGDGAEQIAPDDRFLSWLRAASKRTRRVGAICTGAFVLGEAGLLDGRRAVTHWGWCAELTQRFPLAKVEQDPIYIRDGNVYTSAGVTSGIDLALAMVEEDQGAQRALAIARDLVMFLRRPGGQSQFSVLLAHQASVRNPIEELRPWILKQLSGDLRVSALARRCGMSPRHFARVFAAEKGITPARYVEEIRVEAARILIEGSKFPCKEAASNCGFGSADSMRRSFVRVLGVTASQYSERFQLRTSSGDSGRRVNPSPA
jgi:transcriptional regulator GlxA family with amidase domain